MNINDVIQTTRNWVNKFVIELNLCPFAKAEIHKNTVRFEVSKSLTEEQLLQHLQNELNHLTQNPNIETTLLIHPKVLNDFAAYNDFLSLCDDLLIDMQLDGIYQIASFHPDYQFADTSIEDAENFSNKSPFPMLHILRESSLDHALKNYPHPENIPIKNRQILNKIGAKTCSQLLKKCNV